MNIQALGIAVTATTGIVQIAKTMGLPSRLAPAVALVVGILMTALFSQSFNWGVVAIGVITGLTAAGVYSSVKTTAGK